MQLELVANSLLRHEIILLVPVYMFSSLNNRIQINIERREPRYNRVYIHDEIYTKKINQTSTPEELVNVMYLVSRAY